MYLSKTKMGKRELILEVVHSIGSSSQYVNCIKHFAFLPVDCFQSFSCAKNEA